MAMDFGNMTTEELQVSIQAKISEKGLDAGGDSGLAEYLAMMLQSGETEGLIASELVKDMSFADDDAKDLARWLFQDLIKQKDKDNSNTAAAQPAPQQPPASLVGAATLPTGPQNDVQSATVSSSQGNMQTQESIPTQPKSMRAGDKKGRDMRMLNQMNRNMHRDRDEPFHRIKATPGTGRISKEPPKGPTPKGPKAYGNRNMQRQLQNQIHNPMQQQMQNQMNLGTSPDMSGAGPFMGMPPDQQMQMLQAYEQQARMMSEMFPQAQDPVMQNMMIMMGMNGMNNGMNGVDGMNGMAQMPQQGPHSKKSLADRIQQTPQKSKKFGERKFNGNSEQDTLCDDVDFTSSMEVEPDSQRTGPDPRKTKCRYNIFCSRPDCLYVHSSPAANPETPLDMSSDCSFGAACKNKKCVSKHPSPSTIQAAPHRQQQAECKFYPNCTNPNCPFVHPGLPPCRNGADCTVPNCKFTHSTTACKFNPCLNPHCMYKHGEGQKRGKFEDKVWVANEGGEQGSDGNQQHLSERKFVEDDGDEELILPVKGESAETTTGPTAVDDEDTIV